ncbi:amine oxidase catalytic domain-containing protein [Serendipita vermifera]|nr:amine oxidase catalytic domain-containing protein [Serendipita vermifera]
MAYSSREGIVISTVTYNDNGEIRPLFYRLSLSEMVVPYAETIAPHARKFAFDVGEYGMGTQVNDLTLGCDCLGTIHYMPGSFMSHSGEPVTINHAICIHEEDDGILWTHTEFRPGGRSRSVRSRRLVTSMVANLANYEYAWYYYFGQDGLISFAIRLTGILNVYVLAPGESSAPFGTTVAPQINAHYHQHIFSLRIDPCIDGPTNTVLETDIVPLASPTGSADNWVGNRFVTEERAIKVASEGGRTYDFVKDRRWTIVNPKKRHYASGKPVGYGLMVRGACTELLAKPDYWVGKRAKFATKSLWVVRDDEENPRLWPAGKYATIVWRIKTCVYS